MSPQQARDVLEFYRAELVRSSRMVSTINQRGDSTVQYIMFYLPMTAMFYSRNWPLFPVHSSLQEDAR